MKQQSYLPYIFVLVALLPILILRDYTYNNELRYLSIADEALRNGTFFTFTNHGVPYADKPPLFIWGIMLGKAILGKHCIWLLSLFSLIPAFIIARTMSHWTAAETQPLYRTSGMLMMLTCGLFLGMAIFVRMDMLMCMFIVLSLHTFYKMVKRDGNARRNAILFPVYVFLALFSKGPIGILVPLLSTVVFLLITGRIRYIGHYWGWKTWGILLLGCILWFGGVYLEGGYAYLDNLLFHQTVNRAVKSFHHQEPFYYYGIVMWYALAPWILLQVVTIIRAVVQGRIRTDMQKLFLTVIVTTFVMLSLISSKIYIYLLPIFPFCVYLTNTLLGKWNRWQALTIALPAVIFCAAGPVFAVIAGKESTAWLANGWFYATAILLSVTGIAVLYMLYAQKRMDLGINTLAIGLFIALFAGGWGIPQLNPRLGYRAICQKAMELSQEKHLKGYHVWEVSRAENMDVYLHQDIHYVTWEEMTSGKLQHTILMVPLKKTEEVKEALPGKESYTVGRYTIIIL